MYIILAMQFLVGDTPYDHLVAMAHDRAFSLSVSEIAILDNGDVWAECTLSYDKDRAGPLLAPFCADCVEIPGFGHPWSFLRRSSAKIRGAPEHWCDPNPFMFSLSCVPRKESVIDSGSTISGRIFLGEQVTADFRSDAPAADDIKMTLCTSFYYTTNSPGRAADSLPLPLKWLAVNHMKESFGEERFRRVAVESVVACVTRRTVRDFAKRKEPEERFSIFGSEWLNRIFDPSEN